MEFKVKFKTVRTVALLALAGLAVLVAVFSSYYTLGETQQGVVTTFGRVSSVEEEAGIHFLIPFGIQQVHKVDVNKVSKLEIGYSDQSGSMDVKSDESKMISGDFNIVNVDFFVEYKVSDPVQYLYGSDDPVGIFRSLVQSQIRNVISSYEVDMILTTGKSQIQSDVKEAIIKELESYTVGIQLIDVKIQDAEPPTQEVIEAFKQVETAKQGKETAINQANAYKNSKIPEAKGEADKILQDAEYYRQNRINEAKQQVAMFDAMYSEYVINRDLTKKRMYYEIIESVLPGCRVYIDTTGNGMMSSLPIVDQFTGK